VCVLSARLQNKRDTGVIDVLDSRLRRGPSVPKVRPLSVQSTKGSSGSQHQVQ
ncbi:hypothetical protein ABG768_025247, partial [Culter alburnus]